MFCILLSGTALLYGREDFGDDCLSCHKAGGIGISSNATGTVEVFNSSVFFIVVEAEGETEELTVRWSDVADNSAFDITPISVIDNDANDDDSSEGKVTVEFELTAPEIPRDYSIQIFAAGSGGKGGTLITQVEVKPPEGEPIEVNLFPTAFFLYTRHTMTIEFEDKSRDLDGTITSWFWDFGDGTNSSDQNPIHTYAGLGTYKVILTVTDDKGGINTLSRTYTLPTNRERMIFWGLQIFLGTFVIIITILIATLIATRHRRKETNPDSTSISEDQKKPAISRGTINVMKVTDLTKVNGGLGL